jgi:hypothetical protein
MHSKSFLNKSWWVKLILYSHALDSFGEEFCKAYVGGVAPTLTLLYLFLRFQTMAKNATFHLGFPMRFWQGFNLDLSTPHL